ncbi:hypothetical protein [Caballeronia grimmiae]|uniref:hypothetical protein n=1 Tax=Caballeronia grimmiae TaxID=1071679 RepID=UPI0038BAAB75
MSEWESAFGEGYSGESLGDSVNAGLLREERYAEEQRRKDIFAGLRRTNHQCEVTAKEEALALKWLFEIFDAIKPGTDLRFVVDQFQVGLAADAMTFQNSTSYQGKLAKASFDIFCTRARGINIAQELVARVKEAVGEFMDEAAFEPYTYPTDPEMSVIGFALSRDVKNAAVIAARNYLSRKIRGDVVERNFWEVFSAQLVCLVESAPRTRLKIINLDSIYQGIELA